MKEILKTVENYLQIYLILFSIILYLFKKK